MIFFHQKRIYAEVQFAGLFFHPLGHPDGHAGMVSGALLSPARGAEGGGYLHYRELLLRAGEGLLPRRAGPVPIQSMQLSSGASQEWQMPPSAATATTFLL